ncbi:unnamed protein product [Euphydryas editha]|uniref:Uncharacterized protein n=1 Tax=Euphydryas editha TaxID=104508 RepID=A0AAU9TJB0_EUPED|nr:unnamed protein product [Euphydryas editha]
MQTPLTLEDRKRMDMEFYRVLFMFSDADSSDDNVESTSEQDAMFDMQPTVERTTESMPGSSRAAGPL